MNCILPLFYWAPIQYFTKFYKYENISLETRENYPKQTYRNRCRIYGPNDIQSLQVPVLKGSFHKTNLQNLEISYQTPWVENHLRSIKTAYKSTPYYDYFIDDIEDLYKKNHTRLIDLNYDILKLCLEWLQLEPTLDQNQEYQALYNGHDFRESIHPKSSKNIEDPEFKPQEYIQGFENRHGFVANLSILDLIFNTGMEASSVLKQSIV